MLHFAQRRQYSGLFAVSGIAGQPVIDFRAGVGGQQIAFTCAH